MPASSSAAAELAHRLAHEAEAVCRRYLSNGRREGRYWLVGDIANTPGRSLFVRLKRSDGGLGGVGRWTDTATAEYGDLLDIIAARCRLAAFRDVLDEARRFLSLPSFPQSLTAAASEEPMPHRSLGRNYVSSGSPEAAQRLFALTRPIWGTEAEAYLRQRGLIALHDTQALRFHPRCYYRPRGDGPTETRPALIGAVTDLGGKLTGVQRTYLSFETHGLWNDGAAQISVQRRAMGHLLGNAVRFGTGTEIIAAGEGIETVLSLLMILPAMTMVAGLSAAHLAAILFPPSLRRLYIGRDNDPAGYRASKTLAQRAQAAGIDAIILSPRLSDFNDDLRYLGIRAMRAALRVQLAPEDVERFMCR